MTGGRRWWRGLVLVGAAGLALSVGGPAEAAGNRQLDRLIVTQPAHGWSAEATAKVDGVLSSLAQEEKPAEASEHLQVNLAANAWTRSSNGGRLLILLAGLEHGKGSKVSLVDAARTAASAAAASVCSGATASPPKSDVPVPAIPHSHLVVCPGSGGGPVPSAVSFARGNVFALVVESGLTKAQLLDLAGRQYRELPAAGVTNSPVTV